jgi:hypothetical protein
MALEDNERMQEIALLTSEKVALVGRKWWLALAITIVAVIPAYYIFKFGFIAILMTGYTEPQIIYQDKPKQALTVIDRKIFSLPNNTYSGYVKVKNLELEWGVASQEYVAEFKTLGGTVLTKVNASTFILPSSEKLIVFSRFSAPEKPEELKFTLGPTHFTRKPQIADSFEKERVTLQNDLSGLIVYGGIKNTSAFTIKEVNLPVIVYNSQNEIVGVNYTYINDLLSGERRTFQFSWPTRIDGAIRAEINPEINIFNRDIFEVPTGESPFDNF